MKVIYFFFFVFLLSCNNMKKEYVCGERPCVDKKEFNEYFAKNLTVEIMLQKNKDDQNIDLVKLNTDIKKKESNLSLRQEVKLRKKNKKEKLRIEKIRLLEERKIREAESKRSKKREKIIKTSNPIKKNEKTLNNISNNREVTKKIIEKNTVPIRKSGKLIESKDFQTETTKSNSAKSLCNEIENCDIDKIAEILIQKGENKPFPNITSNNF